MLARELMPARAPCPRLSSPMSAIRCCSGAQRRGALQAAQGRDDRRGRRAAQHPLRAAQGQWGPEGGRAVALHWRRRVQGRALGEPAAPLSPLRPKPYCPACCRRRPARRAAREGPSARWAAARRAPRSSPPAHVLACAAPHPRNAVRCSTTSHMPVARTLSPCRTSERPAGPDQTCTTAPRSVRPPAQLPASSALLACAQPLSQPAGMTVY